ncbi:uncharacterized protein UV8b_03441 [Ustilaginoidea virens]|uniref:Uncharacterized protein n=1 Tax=Ustilaginoidea virens TaxID=1159556 RepID=A0A8E5HPW6_USTVR|nr:uncharacterized protein UV8b_03441 [Ustilaginoidea virens]QUC19200.1 hypothetical protein UV8b_03441 [Ustilaginoidea virens]
MPYSPVKFQSTVVKPYNHDLDNPTTDDAEDIVYAEGPARPGRLKVRIPAPATAAPLTAMIPAAETSSTPAAATYPSPAISSDQTRLVLPLPPPARIISDVIINKDQEEALVNIIASNTVINASFLTAKKQADLQLAS